jgi:hypothetical protein
VKLLVGYAFLTYIARSGLADPGEWDNLVPTELAELPDIPTVFLIITILFSFLWTGSDGSGLLASVS